MSNDIINAVKRLERAGSESGATTQKLVDAANVLLAEINSRIEPVIGSGVVNGTVLPVAVAVKHGLADKPSLTARNWSVAILPLTADRYLALQLGEAVANGLLQDLAEWADARLQAEASATRLMSRAVDKTE